LVWGGEVSARSGNEREDGGDASIDGSKAGAQGDLSIDPKRAGEEKGAGLSFQPGW
jgi:hypothetical protein